MTEYNGDLVIGGYFTSINGVPAQCVARFDGTTWSAMPGLSFAYYVEHLLTVEGVLYCFLDGYGLYRWNETANTWEQPSAMNIISAWNNLPKVGGWEYYSDYFADGVTAPTRSSAIHRYNNNLLVFCNIILRKTGQQSRRAYVIAVWNGTSFTFLRNEMMNIPDLITTAQQSLTVVGNTVYLSDFYMISFSDYSMCIRDNDDPMNRISNSVMKYWSEGPSGGNILYRLRTIDNKLVVLSTTGSTDEFTNNPSADSTYSVHHGVAYYNGSKFISYSSDGLISYTTIHDIKRYNSDLYICGSLTSYNGNTLYNVAKRSESAWVPVGNPNIENDLVYQILVWNGKLLACGGSYLSISAEKSAVASYDGTTWTKLA